MFKHNQKGSVEPQNTHPNNAVQRTATLTIPVSNEHGYVLFEDILMELFRMYEVEKNAKNKAYLCIIETIGHDKHVHWERNHKRRDDYHAACVDVMYDMALEKERETLKTA